MEILDLIQFLLPSGCIGGVVGWLASARIRRARTTTEESHLYQDLVQDMRADIVDLQKNYTKLTFDFYDLKRNLYAATQCTYYGADCPLHGFVQNDKGTTEGSPEQRHKQPND